MNILFAASTSDELKKIKKQNKLYKKALNNLNAKLDEKALNALNKSDKEAFNNLSKQLQLDAKESAKSDKSAEFFFQSLQSESKKQAFKNLSKQLQPDVVCESYEGHFILSAINFFFIALILDACGEYKNYESYKAIQGLKFLLGVNLCVLWSYEVIKTSEIYRLIYRAIKSFSLIKKTQTYNSIFPLTKKKNAKKIQNDINIENKI